MQSPNNTACPDATNQTTPDLDTISVITTISHTSSCRVLFSIIIPLILETLLILALICRLTSFFFFSRYNKTCDAFPLNVTDKTLDRKTVAALATSCYLLEESFIGTCWIFITYFSTWHLPSKKIGEILSDHARFSIRSDLTLEWDLRWVQKLRSMGSPKRGVFGSSIVIIEGDCFRNFRIKRQLTMEYMRVQSSEGTDLVPQTPE